MQLAEVEGRVYHQVFLDLSKAYDTVHRPRLFEILEAYGVGENLMKVLKDSWEDSKVVPRLVKCYGEDVSTQRGVKQGDVTSPLFFNLLIDAILRAVETMMEEELGPHEKPTLHFYADDGRIGGGDPDLIQKYLDKCVELFEAVGLEVNSGKTVSMTSHPNFRWPGHTIGAYNRRLSGEPVDYELRTTVLEECEVCGLEMQLRSLVQHTREQHKEVLNFVPPSLYSPSPARRGPRHFDITWDDEEEMECPVPLCAMAPKTHDAMRQHFCYRHYDQGLSFNEDRSYDKCDLCMKHVRPARLAEHQESKLCKAGNARRKTRELIAAAQLPAPTFYIGEDAVERVSKFRYLGRILSQDDHDLSACVRNIQRAKAKWAAVSKVLTREGASKKSFARFYLVIVSTVLLYGSDTWVVTRRMADLLTSFHNRCLRHITRRRIRCVDTENDVWIRPTLAGVMEEALLLNLHPVMHYVLNRRNGLLLGWSYGGSLAVEPSSGHALCSQPSQRSFATLRRQQTHLRSMQTFEHPLQTPSNFLEPTNTTSRYGSLGSSMEP
jgi:hypothetical protein